jgi:hypothetical protein
LKNWKETSTVKMRTTYPKRYIIAIYCATAHADCERNT